MFARVSHAGFEPTEFTNSRGTFLRLGKKNGSGGHVVHPFIPGVRVPKDRKRLMEEAESAHLANKSRFPRDKNCDGARGLNVWMGLLDVYARYYVANGSNICMQLWHFWWADSMHACGFLRANLWPMLSGDVTRPPPVRKTLATKRHIVETPAKRRADVVARAQVALAFGFTCLTNYIACPT